MLHVQGSSERENMHHPVWRKDRKKISEDVFQLTMKCQ